MQTVSSPTQSNLVTLSPLQKLAQLEAELNQRFLEREQPIRLLLLALLTRQHALIFGSHGAAKSNLVQALADAFSGRLFRVQLGKDTTRDHVFGPVKVTALQQDRQCYAFENFLPGSNFAFLDEIDKANTVILNSLYTAMEERQFLNDGNMQAIPLNSLFGAANRIEKLQTEELLPLLDRFLIRIEVEWIQADANFLEYLNRTANYQHPAITTQISLTELQALQLEVQQVQFPRETIESVGKLKKTLQGDGIVVSDRRWGHIITLLKANALLHDDGFVWDEHFACLTHVLWTDKKQIPVLEKHLKPFADNTTAKAVKDLLKRAKAKTNTVLGITEARLLLGQASLVNTDLQAAKDELAAMWSQVSPKYTKAVEKGIETLNNLIDQVIEHRKQICQF